MTKRKHALFFWLFFLIGLGVILYYDWRLIILSVAGFVKESIPHSNGGVWRVQKIPFELDADIKKSLDNLLILQDAIIKTHPPQFNWDMFVPKDFLFK